MSDPDTHPIIAYLESVKGLPSPPQVALKIIDVSRDSEKGIGDLTEVLQHDPALTAKILKIANSASYAQGRDLEISTLLEAANLLGANSLRIVALGFLLRNALPGFQHDDLSDVLIWRHSVATGVACRKVASFCGRGDSETAFLSGLMSRIGQLVFLTLTPETYLPVVAKSEVALPSSAEEHAQLGMTHHQVGRMLLDKWNLPILVREVVEKWSDTTSSIESDEVRQMVNYVRFGDQIRALIFESNKGEGLQRLYKIGLESFLMPESEVDRLLLSCQQELQETMSVFEESLEESIKCDEILAMAREQTVQVGLRLANHLAETKDKAESLSISNRELEKRSLTDALTNLPNRLALDRELALLDDVNSQNNDPHHYAIIMVDIDHFKEFNDKYGHVAGDQALQAVANSLAESVQATDFVARFGGEEFIVILSNCRVAEAETAADRFHRAVESTGIELRDRTVSVTASVGVACSEAFPPATSQREVLQCADLALYHAKRTGRNKVRRYSDDISTSKR